MNEETLKKLNELLDSLPHCPKRSILMGNAQRSMDTSFAFEQGEMAGKKDLAQKIRNLLSGR